MPVLESTRELLKNIAEAREERAEKRLKAGVRSTILTVTGGLPINETELSLALGVFAPEPGTGGSSIVSQWKRGEKKPGPEMLVALEMLAQGELRLKHIGKNGRRNLFELTHTVCPNCGWVMKRRGSWDYCNRCLNKAPADAQLLAIDQGGIDGEPDLQEMLAWVARGANIEVNISRSRTDVKIIREPHRLSMSFKELEGWEMKSGDRVWASKKPEE